MSVAEVMMNSAAIFSIHMKAVAFREEHMIMLLHVLTVLSLLTQRRSRMTNVHLVII